MPLFIVLSLALCFMVQTASPLQSVLLMPLLTYIGLALAVISLLGSLWKKWATLLWYDLFASGLLMVWFAYWKPSFIPESPLFFFYTLYFALVTALVNLFFIDNREKIDAESLSLMNSLANKSWSQPWLIMVGVMVSLAFPEKFMLYPTLMTLLIVRFALASCLWGKKFN